LLTDPLQGFPSEGAVMTVEMQAETAPLADLPQTAEWAQSASPAQLLRTIEALTDEVVRDGDRRFAAWSDSIARPEFAESARNLAHYLALRHHDLRPLQRALVPLGLSSLGRLEGHVLPSLNAVRIALQALSGQPHALPLGAEIFLAGERRLAERSVELFGAPGAFGQVAMLVTAPQEAAETPAFMQALAERGVQAIRINCAHDDASLWARMIENLRAAEASTGHSIKILMDLAGPKIRTGMVRTPQDTKRMMRGNTFAIVREGGLDSIPKGRPEFAAECTLPEAISTVQPGHRIFVDDGKLGAMVEKVMPWGLIATVTAAEVDGLRLKPEKGLNFPDTELGIAALTAQDEIDLDFVAAHADGVEFSFVQSAADVQLLQQALAKRRPEDWRSLSLVLKIETARAVRNLPDLIVQAAGQQPTAIMIARGDLAVEIGFARTAEMQEEILWLGEAAHVPVIWATQVLEHLIQKGTPLRGEMTDAAMAARAECIMLNKGPFLLEALDQLATLVGRMEANQHKKSPQQRRLESW